MGAGAEVGAGAEADAGAEVGAGAEADAGAEGGEELKRARVEPKAERVEPKAERVELKAEHVERVELKAERAEWAETEAELTAECTGVVMDLEGNGKGEDESGSVSGSGSVSVSGSGSGSGSGSEEGPISFARLTAILEANNSDLVLAATMCKMEDLHSRYLWKLNNEGSKMCWFSKDESSGRWVGDKTVETRLLKIIQESFFPAVEVHKARFLPHEFAEEEYRRPSCKRKYSVWIEQVEHNRLCKSFEKLRQKLSNSRFNSALIRQLRTSLSDFRPSKQVVGVGL